MQEAVEAEANHQDWPFDVGAHQSAHVSIGPCWVLVRVSARPQVEARSPSSGRSRAGSQLTPEARAAFESADVALYLVADPVEVGVLERLNPRARSLYDHYEVGRPRQEIYDRMAEEILTEVRSGHTVCAAFYGHPGIFVSPSHQALLTARAEGYPARMLPAVSAEDCLFADLGVDPGEFGCQSYEATDFLLRRRQVDPSAALVLWQVAVIGERVYAREPPRNGSPCSSTTSALGTTTNTR